ncbi:MAG: cytosine deaminase, partial [Spirochaetes bacterium]
GHEALPFGTGSLTPGSPADFVVWNLDLPNTAPAYNPLASLIYSSDARNAEHVIIAGEFVKQDGQLKLDTKEIVREAKERARGILQKGKGSTKLVF